ncbi:MAG: UDP-N-acetylmuramate--L-alanine ligase [Phycisphaerae bacterium]|nr:UDP-N-acetylmuramate--L-alanine ligase [Phycisphaerae bacterium]
METERESRTDQSSTSYLGRRVHLIGIGGSGMRGLAQMLLDAGAVVSGSDSCGNGSLQRLRDAGATVAVGQAPENLPDGCELVVYTAAVSDQNPERIAAKRRGIEVIKYAEMLGRLMRRKTGLAVAGTHGKSTTTAMVAYALRQAGADPSFIVGATVEQLGGPSGAGAGEHFVAEACEFDRSFLNLSPKYAAILNIEEDHLDCYRDLEAIIEAFRAFTSRVGSDGVLIANGEDRNVLEATRDALCDVETFGFTDDCHWRGEVLGDDRGRVHLVMYKAGEEFCRFTASLPGMHNAYNSLAAAGLLYHAGLKPSQIAEHLATFGGAKRRMTLKAQDGGITVVDDYAHHPTEIQASLRALRDYYRPERMLCIFQPHQHSRTRFLLKDFAASFAQADEVILPDIYFVRDSEKEKDHISSSDLVAQIRMRGGSARYEPTFEGILEYMKTTLRDGDLVVTMGAGNVWELADELVRWIREDR